MNNKTLIKLEFDKIISMLENEASSFRGKQLCRRLKPVTDLTKIDLLQEQTRLPLLQGSLKNGADFFRRRSSCGRISQTT